MKATPEGGTRWPQRVHKSRLEEGTFRPCRLTPRRSIIWTALALLLLFNALAYRHARAFFNYVENAERTPPPEQLSWRQKAVLLFTGVQVPKPKAHSHPADFGLSSEDITVPGRGDMPLAAWRIPADEARCVVVLFHGYNSEKSGLLPEARLFHQLGNEVLLVDFPGSGGSAGRQTSLGIFEAEDVARVHAWIRREYPDRQVVLYGHSMGAAAVLRAMALFDVRPDAAIVESVFDSLLQAIRYRFNLMSFPGSPGAETLLFWGSLQLGANGFKHRPVDYAGRVEIPTLVIHGKQDNRASWEGAERVHRALKGDKALLLMYQAGHVNPSMADPERWRAEVDAFIRER